MAPLLASSAGMLLLLLLSTTTTTTTVSAHGFLSAVVAIDDGGRTGTVRDYDKIGYHIDVLRNPTKTLCRGTDRGDTTPLVLGKNGDQHTVTMAFSVGAQHIGTCRLEVFDVDSPDDRVQIAEVGGPNSCAVPQDSDTDVVVPNLNTHKEPGASDQCNKKHIPDGLTVDDMCLWEWTFILANVDKIRCNNCVLRWAWIATHTDPNEHYENCVDVDITTPYQAHVGTSHHRNVTQNISGPSASSPADPAKIDDPFQTNRRRRRGIHA